MVAIGPRGLLLPVPVRFTGEFDVVTGVEARRRGLRRLTRRLMKRRLMKRRLMRRWSPGVEGELRRATEAVMDGRRWLHVVVVGMRRIVIRIDVVSVKEGRSAFRPEERLQKLR